MQMCHVMIQFYFWFKFYFPLFFSMVMYDKEFETMGNEIWTKNKIEPQYIIHQMLIILIKRIKDSKDFKGERWGYVFSIGITMQSVLTSQSGNQILQFQKKKNRAIDSVLTWILSTFKDQITTVKT